MFGTFTIFYTVNHPTNAPETTLALKNGSLLTFWFCFGHMFLWNIDTNFYIVMYARCNPRSNATARTLINNLSRCSASNSSARSVMVKMTESNLEYNSMLMFVCLVGFLTSLSTTRLYRGRVPRQSVWQFNLLPQMRQSWETMTSVSASHIILTPTQPVGSRRSQWESNPGPPYQVTRSTDWATPLPPCWCEPWLCQWIQI